VCGKYSVPFSPKFILAITLLFSLLIPICLVIIFCRNFDFWTALLCPSIIFLFVYKVIDGMLMWLFYHGIIQILTPALIAKSIGLGVIGSGSSYMSRDRMLSILVILFGIAIIMISCNTLSMIEFIFVGNADALK